jgi:hypothetical protein
LAAGVLAVVLASAAVGRVGNQVTGDRPPPLSAADVRDELAAEAAASSTTTVADAPTSTDLATTTTTAARVDTPSTLTTAAPPATAGQEEIRSYALVGGTATLRFAPAGVSVVSATPNPGFTVEVEPHGGGVEVQFRSDAHRSRLEASWDGGPQAQTEERAESDDD